MEETVNILFTVDISLADGSNIPGGIEFSK
ncbi:hypothetical protein BAL199_13133 [alpha proteobacterium BAL199]|nr:hypothetical protein BAL199_13133 [alpha proteobacterium BAL199]